MSKPTSSEIDCSLFFYLSTHAKGKASDTSAKHAGLGVGKEALGLPSPYPVKSLVLGLASSSLVMNVQVKIRRENRSL